MRLPDDAEFQTRWRDMSMAERRPIVRAVNRGSTMDAKRDAAMAAVLARRQARFWRIAGTAAPLVGIAFALLFGRTDTSTTQLFLNATVGAIGLGALALFRFRRARVAELDNTEKATGRRPATD